MSTVIEIYISFFLFYGPKFGLFGIALHLTSRAAILIVPNLTEQDCVVLDSTAVSCSGLDGTGLG